MARRAIAGKVLKSGKVIFTIPQIKVSTDLIFRIPDLFYIEENGQKIPVDMGKNYIRYEYEAHVNRPEIVRVTVLDPHSTIFDEHMKKYFVGSIPFPPIMMITQGRWIPAGVEPKLELTKKEHVLISITDIGPGQGSADQTILTFTGIDLPHYLLGAGDAGGYVYEGRLSDVIPQVCDRYSRGLFKTIFRSRTRDDQHNKWWQNRMYPLAFIKSLLRWSTPLTKQKTRWIFWSDTDIGDKGRRFEIFEQRDDPSKHRATYWWGADTSRPGHGDILEFKMVGDNSRDTWRGKIVTSGISTLSGAYHDRISHWRDKDTVYIDERQTGNKYVQRSRAKEAYTQPSTDEPLRQSIGWTKAHSLPELAAGEMGLRYEDYIDGYARGEYYKDALLLQHVEFRLYGHHIWSESIGLGYDTIDIMWRTQKDQLHFIHGTWIVDGFKHIISARGWETILYCHRLHFNAKGSKVGKPKQ